MLGVKVDSFEVKQMELANYFLGCLVRNRMTNFRFWVINVYGPAHHELSEDFILELTKFRATETLPILWEDFNLITSNKDRNKGQGDPKLMDLFNNFIGNLHLREIFISGVKFTWSNKQKSPTLIKLDRILVSTSWDLNYSHSFAWSKARIGSDHSPLIIDSGEQGASRPKYFFFEQK
jgi:endonuclease/exonuclease/phosphatase family metal-dependent hydrolase